MVQGHSKGKTVDTAHIFFHWCYSRSPSPIVFFSYFCPFSYSCPTLAHIYHMMWTEGQKRSQKLFQGWGGTGPVCQPPGNAPLEGWWMTAALSRLVELRTHHLIAQVKSLLAASQHFIHFTSFSLYLLHYPWLACVIILIYVVFNEQKLSPKIPFSCSGV